MTIDWSQTVRTVIEAAKGYFKGDDVRFVGIRGKDWQGDPDKVETLCGVQVGDGRYVLLERVPKKDKPKRQDKKRR